MRSLRDALLQPFFGRAAASSEAPPSQTSEPEEQQQPEGAAWDEAAAKAAPVRPVPWQRGMNLRPADTTSLARSVRLREQAGRPYVPGCRKVEDVLRRAKGVNEPAEKEHFDRPLPQSPFPQLVLELGEAIDRYLRDREAAQALAAGGGGARPRLPLVLQQPPPPSMERPARRMWRPVAEAVTNVRERLLMEGLTRPEQAREREMFIDARGPETLLRLLEPPMVTDAAIRAMPKEGVATVAEAYNDVLSLIRDLVYFVPDLAPRLATPSRFVSLFSLLKHQATFDHACGLLEDLLVDLAFTPFLGDVPHLNELLEGLSLRQLAHFCRVLALLVFEPQDRFLIESDVQMMSRDILQLRRDRLQQPNPGCDRNQALLLHLPCVLKRLVQLIRVINHAPSLHEMAKSRHGGGVGGGGGGGGNNNQQQQQRRPHDLFLLLADMIEVRDWARVDQLEAFVRDGRRTGGAAAASSRGRRMLSPSDLLSLIQPVLLARVRQRFAPPDEIEVDRVLQLVHHMAEPEAAGATTAATSGGGEQQEQEQNESGEQGGGGGGGGGGGVFGSFFRRAQSSSSHISSSGGGDGTPSTSSLGSLSVGEARAELEFMGVSLMAYQTEVLFVLCSLVGGRRKASFQDKLVGELGLLEALTDMFPRLSWGKKARHFHHHGAGGPGGFGDGQPIFVNLETGQVVGLEGLAGLAPGGFGPLVDGFGGGDEDFEEDVEDDEEEVEWEEEQDDVAYMMEAQQQGPGQGEMEEDEEEDDGEPSRLHGEHCNCTPDSALRIQYLRLLHNTLDRDDAGAAFRELKSRALGAEERAALLRWDADGELAAVRRAAEGKAPKGLATQILEVLAKEPKDSSERFWLCSAFEAFLRGAGPSVQRHVAAAHAGLVEERLLGEVLADGLQVVPGLKQSAFDLLGELARGNPSVLARIEAALPDAEAFGRLEEVIMANLVDSNVFLRSVLLALYVEDSDGDEEDEEGLSADVGRLAVGDAAEESGGGQGFSYLCESWARPTMARVPVSDDAGGSNDDDPLLRRSREQAAWQRRERQRQSPRPGTAAARALLPRFHAFMQRNWLGLLQRMMAAVDFSQVNHESLCVLNSALLMLLLSRREGRLAEVVAALRTQQQAELEKAGEQPKARFSWAPPRPGEDDADEEAGAGPVEAIRHKDFLGNFRALLYFWASYYMSRGRDRLSLEFSSRIPFAEWRQVLDAVCADDLGRQPASLVPAPLRLPRSPYALPARYPVLRGAR